VRLQNTRESSLCCVADFMRIVFHRGTDVHDSLQWQATSVHQRLLDANQHPLQRG
jgi:hypothetical protein